MPETLRWRIAVSSAAVAAYGLATAISIASAIGLLASGPFKPGFGLADTVSGRYFFGIPAEFAGLAIATAWLAMFGTTLWQPSSVRVVDRCVFPAAVILSAGTLFLILSAAHIPYLLVGCLATSAAMLVTTASALDAQPHTTSGRLLAFPTPMAVAFFVLAAASLGARATSIAVQGHAGVPALERQLPAWLNRLEEHSLPWLMPSSGTRVVVFVGTSPPDPLLRSQMSVLSAYHRLRVPVETHQLVLTQANPCDHAERPFECDTAALLQMLLATNRTTEADGLRRQLWDHTQDGTTPSLASLLAHHAVREEFEASRAHWYSGLALNRARADQLAVRTLPTIFVNGKRLPRITPDMFDGVLREMTGTAK